jgi:diaminohydroxyphosphoribosylaminopyrimidine deaminase/5-amino-6-(5-phosphoribosylamino)uracil reductase
MNTPDTTFMMLAIQLAQRGLYTTKPNPRVGCVIVKNHKIMAEGFHERAGEGHAEVNALSQLINSRDAKGATAYITLEPCCHTGKTAPCTDALISAGIARVVYGMEDPNPLVAGKGLQILRDAGIEVCGPLLEKECRALNPGFIKRMQTGLPFVRCKLAMSLDGRTAMANGESKWITGEDAREDVQRLRAQSCAIITGIDTVIKDDPELTVRSEHLPASAKEKQPLRVVLDRQQRMSSQAKILQQASETLIIHHSDDLRAVLKTLGDRQCNEILIEAGATLAGAFIRDGLVDELIVYMAPILLGSNARPLLQLPFETMDQRIKLDITEMRNIGQDWRITATPST